MLLKEYLRLYVKALLESEELDEFSSVGGGGAVPPTQIQGYVSASPAHLSDLDPKTSKPRKRKKRK